jgi:hypothetical protein
MAQDMVEVMARFLDKQFMSPGTIGAAVSSTA